MQVLGDFLQILHMSPAEPQGDLLRILTPPSLRHLNAQTYTHYTYTQHICISQPAAIPPCILLLPNG
uniref:Uncharacterized protein n=1 Tax=Anguilla anguilla TaxID=7936 RepID=A0A0E9TUF0_ANGAN